MCSAPSWAGAACGLPVLPSGKGDERAPWDHALHGTDFQGKASVVRSWFSRSGFWIVISGFDSFPSLPNTVVSISPHLKSAQLSSKCFNVTFLMDPENNVDMLSIPPVDKSKQARHRCEPENTAPDPPWSQLPGDTEGGTVHTRSHARTPRHHHIQNAACGKEPHSASAK